MQHDLYFARWRDTASFRNITCTKKRGPKRKGSNSNQTSTKHRHVRIVDPHAFIASRPSHRCYCNASIRTLMSCLSYSSNMHKISFISSDHFTPDAGHHSTYTLSPVYTVCKLYPYLIATVILEPHVLELHVPGSPVGWREAFIKRNSRHSVHQSKHPLGRCQSPVAPQRLQVQMQSRL